jgi:hypothetical protein
MNRFKETIRYATAYSIAADLEGSDNSWFVQHTKRSNKIVWGQHQFMVIADMDDGVYTCECKRWEHTSMLLLENMLCF